LFGEVGEWVVGVTFRKSIVAGPVRFNLSGSGIGVSAGVKGFRVGSGPRGGYVRAERGGIHYQRTLGGPVRAPAPRPGNGEVGEGASAPGNLTGEHVEALVAASPSEIVQRISEAAALRKPRVLPNMFSYGGRKLRWLADRAVPLFYDLDSELLAGYEQVDSASDGLARSSGRYYDVDSQAISGA
jgi:hypothetical protein